MEIRSVKSEEDDPNHMTERKYFRCPDGDLLSIPSDIRGVWILDNEDGFIFKKKTYEVRLDTDSGNSDWAWDCETLEEAERKREELIKAVLPEYIKS